MSDCWAEGEILRIGVTVTEELFGSGQKLDLKLIISSYLIISVDEYL
jgi:hypothetical protein